MFTLPKAYFKSETVHRRINSDNINGQLSCGFLNKKAESTQDVNITFEYYGGLLLLSGEGSQIDNEGNEYKLYPGCFVQRIPDKPHSTYVGENGNWVEFFICFGKDIFESLNQLGILCSKNDVLYPGLSMKMLGEFELFMDKLKRAEDSELPFLLLEAQKLIIQIYKMHKEGNNKVESNEIIRKSCRLLVENANIQKGTSYICDDLGMGYENFRKLFKRQTGMSPNTYINEHKINMAKSMLLSSGLSIKEIAHSLNFADQFVFSKLFKKYTGKSPKAFKESYL
jgi:AraC family transcriptional regulator of arabinose operon